MSELTAPGTLQQNSVVEIRNITLLDMVRSVMSFFTLPTFFWGTFALETTIYLLILVPSKSGPLTPRELWSWRKPILHHIHI